MGSVSPIDHWNSAPQQWSTSWDKPATANDKKKKNTVPATQPLPMDNNSMFASSLFAEEQSLFKDKLDADAWTSSVAIASQKKKKEEEKAAKIEDEIAKQSLYKTELCRSFVDTGACRYGQKCQFAHGMQELRPILRHPKYKTEVCKNFATTGQCSYGARCRFIHFGSLPEKTSELWSTSWNTDPAPKTSPTKASFPKADDSSDDAELELENGIRRLAIFQRIAN